MRRSLLRSHNLYAEAKHLYASAEIIGTIKTCAAHRQLCRASLARPGPARSQPAGKFLSQQEAAVLACLNFPSVL